MKIVWANVPGSTDGVLLMKGEGSQVGKLMAGCSEKTDSAEECAWGEYETLSFSFKKSWSKHSKGTSSFAGLTQSLGKGALSI